MTSGRIVIPSISAVMLACCLAANTSSAQDVQVLDDPTLADLNLDPEVLKFMEEERKNTRVTQFSPVQKGPQQPGKTGGPKQLDPAHLEQLLAGPMAGVEEVVFSVRTTGKDGHWYANFGYWSSDTNRWLYGEGGRLVRVKLRTRETVDILNDPQGTVRDPCVHYDGKRIVFSYRPAGSRCFNLYEINADGTGLRQMTSGQWDDIEPVYTPDDGIIFCSSRCKRWVNCWYSHVAVLYRLDAGGGNPQILSSNVEHDNTPWMLADGRVIYTRWEYIDRSQVRYHHLWAMNPDGTAQTVFFGNMNAGTAMLDAKSIPGTDKVVAIFSPGHGRIEHMGSLTVVDPNAGPDDLRYARGVPGFGNARDPYAFSEDCIMLAQNNEIVVTDGSGNRLTLYTLPERGFLVHEPRPLCPRPREHRATSRVRPKALTGNLVLMDITHGRNMAEVRPGEIKKLLVLESLPKPINHSGGQEPLSNGGTFTLPRVLGTVPVEPDGSAFLEVPAVRSLFLVALDEKDLSVKRMQSFVTVLPGETLSCAGCHEQRTDTPKQLPRGTVMALRRPASRIEPFAGIPDVLDFPRDIQPILDRNCVRCHDIRKHEGGILLTGDREGKYSYSYLTLRRFVVDGRNADGNRPPRSVGTSASPLMKKIDGGHHDVKLSDKERLTVRLWIETGATYPGTYAALGSGMANVRIDKDVLKKRCTGCHAGIPLNGTYQASLSEPEKSAILMAPLAKEAGGWGLCKGDRRVELAPPTAPPGVDGSGERVRPKPGGAGSGPKFDAKTLDLLGASGEDSATSAEVDQLFRDLAKKPDNPKQPKSDKKKAQPAPAKPDAPEGGPAVRTEHVEAVFADRADPDYRKLLDGLIESRKELDAQGGRFDMLAFRPTVHYVREMKRYGILPDSFDRDKDPIDVYAVEQAYWRSLWWPAISPPSDAKTGDTVPRTASKPSQ